CRDRDSLFVPTRNLSISCRWGKSRRWRFGAGCERSSLNFVLFLNPFSARDALVGGRIRRNGIYGRFAGIAGSIRFNARELHHFGRLFGFLGEELTEVGG